MAHVSCFQSWLRSLYDLWPSQVLSSHALRILVHAIRPDQIDFPVSRISHQKIVTRQAGIIKKIIQSLTPYRYAMRIENILAVEITTSSMLYF